MKLIKQANEFKDKLVKLSDNGFLDYDDCIIINFNLKNTIEEFKKLPLNQENQEVILILMQCELEIEMAITYLAKLELETG